LNERGKDCDVVDIINAAGIGPAVILCEHASNHIPDRYEGLGLSPDARESHAAWDPGASALAQALSAALDAPLVMSAVSRLVYDCNRPPQAESAIAALSERIAVPGNRDLSASARQERIDTVYAPFMDAVSRLLAGRLARGLPTALLTVHSFTPVFQGQARDVEIGILHDADSRLADAMLAVADGYDIRRNAPYGPEDGVTHSLRVHGMAHGLLNVMIEVRSDLLASPEACRAMAERVENWFTAGLSAFEETPRREARA